MYAIVEVLGKQYRVQEGAKVVVDLMDAEKDSEVTLDRVLMIGGEAAKIGTPVVEGAKETAKKHAGTKVVIKKAGTVAIDENAKLDLEGLPIKVE